MNPTGFVFDAPSNVDQEEVPIINFELSNIAVPVIPSKPQTEEQEEEKEKEMQEEFEQFQEVFDNLKVNDGFSQAMGYREDGHVNPFETEAGSPGRRESHSPKRNRQKSKARSPNGEVSILILDFCKNWFV